ncbi:hypothetical protein B0T25DRAFT_443592 [Lasiosphaeria hispida]|uniref:P-loop containing nucleoside triphosphate hydrolase protein n=1 Tax=Lasiosphaeria hispida TaxID=260671 RepID=A0AAJ0ML41_9PEZI|nr:hypothetical protein B0T25DRAFT_443592 [Lasiosphaeria hispida]
MAVDGKVKTPVDEAASTSSGDMMSKSNRATPSEAEDEGEYSSEDEVDSRATMRDIHMRLLAHRPELDELNEVRATPIFTEAVHNYAVALAGIAPEKPFSQYGLLAGDISGVTQDGSTDNRIFWNIAAPSSFFICGSQGSGKSHTLSCLLENALARCPANVLPHPLTGIVFHYDTFISDTGGSPCEVAWLASNLDINVRVLCPPTNIRTMKKLYSRFPTVTVEELRLNESDLNTKRMLDLMAVTSGGMPLYLHVVNRILRELRVEQQRTGATFSYTAFKKMLLRENLTEMQLSPLRQRLETLESFMVEDEAKAFNMFSRNCSDSKNPVPKRRTTLSRQGTDWTPRPGQLTIVDLSCPCVTAEMACSLFNISLSLFLEQSSATVGRIIALDEAHKYMNDSPECQTLTEALLATIRLQRHLGARVVISTQEPTISPKLLDLCSVTVVHRFTSPDWLNALRKHLAGVSAGSKMLERAESAAKRAAAAARVGGEEGEDGVVDGAGAMVLGEGDPGMELFAKIVTLKVGEALMFAPSAVVGVERRVGESSNLGMVKRLAHGVMKVRMRHRTTADGGQSIMAA